MAYAQSMPGAKANWFIGLPVSPVGWFVERIGAPPEAVRVFHPDDLHLTVAFLGSCGDEAANAAFELVRAAPASASHATLDSIVPMGNPRRPSALSAVLRAGLADITDYLMAHRDRLRAAAGAPVEQRPPRPHCTVARPTRRASPRQRRAAIHWASEIDVADVPVDIGPVSLYTWADDRRVRLFRVVRSANSWLDHGMRQLLDSRGGA